MSGLSKINIFIQRLLFPALEEEIGVLSEKERQCVRILELVEIQPLLAGLDVVRNWSSTCQQTITGEGIHCKGSLEYSDHKRAD